MTVEVSTGETPYDVLVHESWHAFVQKRDAQLSAAIAQASGLEHDTLSEGMAYAVSPGILRAPSATTLEAMVASDVRDQKTFDDAYARFHRLALALRPSLERALKDPGQDLLTFLPRAIDIYVGVQSLSRGLDKKEKQRGWFLLGREVPALWKRLSAAASAKNINLWGRGLNEAQVPFDRADPTVVVLLLTKDDLDAPLPAPLLTIPGWEATKQSLRAGRAIEDVVRKKDLKVIVIGAEDEAALRDRVGKSKALEELLR
jgi:hypothetical protein